MLLPRPNLPHQLVKQLRVLVNLNIFRAAQNADPFSLNLLLQTRDRKAQVPVVETAVRNRLGVVSIIV